MRWNGLSRKAGDRMRIGRRTISVPGVPSMTDPDGPTEASGPTDGADRPSQIDRKAVQYLDRVRAIFVRRAAMRWRQDSSASSAGRTYFGTLGQPIWEETGRSP
jgi:hypothetical protein